MFENSSEQLVTVAANVSSNSTNNTLAWANEWLGYLALGMFSMVLLVPTLGIVGLMVWEYFSDEAERKAERLKEIDQVMTERYSGVKRVEEEQPIPEDEDYDEEDDDDYETTDTTPFLHKRNPIKTKPEDFDCL